MNEKRTILLIDDDTSLLLTLSDFLKFEGYNVVTADSGEEGLKRLERVRPDVIILDMSMPGMGGIGFLKAISSSDGKPKYPVLVLTARANMAEFFANVDVDGFIAKPCDPADLLMEVARIVFLRSGGGGEKESPGERRLRILLGEDDKVAGMKLTNAFTAAGYEVASAFKGTEVLERAIVEKPDVVVVNLLLTGMNGDVVARMLREMPSTKDIRIVMYGDDADDPARVKAATQLGQGTVLVPGVKPAAILSAVRDVVGV